MAVKISRNSNRIHRPEELSLSSYGSRESKRGCSVNRTDQHLKDSQQVGVDKHSHSNRTNMGEKTIQQFSVTRTVGGNRQEHHFHPSRTVFINPRVVSRQSETYRNKTFLDKTRDENKDKLLDTAEEIGQKDKEQKNEETTEDVSVLKGGCLTKPDGTDLDQVIVGQGRFKHRQLFESAYRVGNLIGRGGFGSVYAGVRLQDNKIVAIKQVAREKIRLWCSADGASVPKEVCLMRHCHGLQNVIRLLDFYEKPDSFILILSRPSCYKDLFDFITERGTLDDALTQKFFKEIFSAVVALKERNVVHRDIKDENILVNLKTNSCFIIDFGSGCHFDAGPLTEFEGTHLYAPPEWLCLGEYSAECATVWSLGVLLYVMTNGDLPFSSQKEIVRGDLRFRQQPSLGAKELIKECLIMEPKNRLNLSEVGDHPWVKQQIIPIKSISGREKKKPAAHT